MAEALDFTGERVVPGQVDPDLWNEHLSRYCLALEHAAGRRVIDLGSGSGYGSWLLATTAESGVGVDVDARAVDYARSRFKSRRLRFKAASALDTGLPSMSADVITAFELIEHLPDADALLNEAKRLLSHDGILLVSTPNRDFYAKTRGAAGANPYHVREYSEPEYREALQRHFLHVRILRQNHTAGVLIEDEAAAATLTSSSVGSLGDSHFFVAICAHAHLPEARSVFVAARGGNLLADRLAHIEKLQAELATKDEWLQRAAADQQALMVEHHRQIAAYGALEGELTRSNDWARSLDAQLTGLRKDLATLMQRVSELEAEMSQQASGYQDKVSSLEDELARAHAWGASLDGQLAAKQQEHADTLAALHHTEAELDERTKWAQTLDAERDRLTQQVAMAAGSRWVKLGRRLGVGPAFRVERPY